MTAPDAGFAGSIPRIYESHLVPLIFEPFAEDLACRLAESPPARVLEIAAGTGALTRAMARQLPPSTAIVATDLNQPMLDQAARTGAARPVQFRIADAMALPFADASFDAVAVQFGAMFYPDRIQAHAEARRVLEPGGCYRFSVWDSLEHNDVPRVVARAVAAQFPRDPPGFLARTPYGHHDRARLAREVIEAGFGVPTIETLRFRSRAASALDAAVAFCHGTPLRTEIEARDPNGLARVTQAAALALAQEFGTGPLDTAIQALLVTVRR